MHTMDDFVTATENGRIFTATFTKRTTGETRVMNCRLGVEKHLKGGSLAFDPSKKGLLPVYDMQSKGYRMIALDGLQTVKIGGAVYRWTGEAFVIEGKL